MTEQSSSTADDSPGQSSENSKKSSFKRKPSPRKREDGASSGRSHHKNSQVKKSPYSFDFYSSLRLDLREAPFIIYDIETTGGNPEKNGITEIFAARVKNGEITDRFYSLINPKIPVPPIVRRMTGITNQMLQGQPTIEDIMPSFVEFVGGDPVVSHNAIGDLKFLRYYAKKVIGHDFMNFFICTHLLAQRLMPEAPKKSLSGLLEHLAIDMGDKHRAESDALGTKLLFDEICAALRQKSCMTVIDAIRYQGDIESSIRVGWDLPKDAMNSIPNTTGIFYLYSKSRHMIFASSAQSMQAELKRLANFNQTSKGVVRHIVHSADIQYDRYPNIFAAMLDEIKVFAKFPDGFLPSHWHGRQLEALMLVRENQKLSFKIGPLQANCLAAFGPIFDRKKVQNFLASTGRVLKDLDVDMQDLSQGVVNLLVAKLNQNLAMTYFKSLWQNLKSPFSGEQRSPLALARTTLVAMKLKNLPSPGHFTSLLGTSGLIAVSSSHLGQIELYTIAACRIINHQRLAGNLEKFSPSKAMLKKLQNEISIHQNNASLLFDPQEARVANVILWFVHQGVHKNAGYFFPITT